MYEKHQHWEMFNMWPVGFRVTRILTDSVCLKTSWALLSGFTIDQLFGVFVPNVGCLGG